MFHLVNKRKSQAIQKQSYKEIITKILNYNYITGIKLLLDFGTNFQHQFIILHVKLQNCHDRIPYISAPRWLQGFKIL